MDAIRVVISDSQHLLADALGKALSRLEDLSIVDDYPSTGPQALDAAKLWRPDVMLLESGSQTWKVRQPPEELLWRLLNARSSCLVGSLAA